MCMERETVQRGPPVLAVLKLRSLLSGTELFYKWSVRHFFFRRLDWISITSNIDIGSVKIWRSNFATLFHFQSRCSRWQLLKEVKYFYLAFASLVSLRTWRTPDSFLPLTRHGRGEMSCLSLKIEKSVTYKFAAERNCLIQKILSRK